MLNGSLNHMLFEDIIYNVVRNEGKTTNINLQNIRFIDPYCLVGLITMARHCANTNTSLEMALPGYNVKTYMDRMNVFSTIKNYSKVDSGYLFEFKRKQNPLLEVTKVDTNNTNEIVSLTDLLQARMDMMFRNHPLFNDPIIYRVITSIIEICQNLDHSGDYGYVAAQKYEDPFVVKIGVMDLGNGITKTLKGKYQKKGEEWSDRKALQLAIQPEVSSRPTGGGFGLSQLTKFVVNHPFSELMIRSGTAKCIVSKGNINVKQGYTYFPGTQISLIIQP